MSTEISIITKDYSDQRPVEDILWPHTDYLSLYQALGLTIVQVESPLATGNEGIDWLAETSVAPFRIYVLKRATVTTADVRAPLG